MINYKKYSRFFLISSIVLLCLTGFLKVLSLYEKSVPKISETVSVSIVGCDQYNIFIDITVKLHNKSFSPSELKNTFLSLYSDGKKVSDLSVIIPERGNSIIYINPRSVSHIKLRTSVSKYLLKDMLINNNNVDKMFEIKGDTEHQVFNLLKSIELSHSFNLNIYNLFKLHLENTLKNSIFVLNDKIEHRTTGTAFSVNYPVLSISAYIFNRSGLNLELVNFKAIAFINRRQAGTVKDFKSIFIDNSNKSQSIALNFELDKISSNELSQLSESRNNKDLDYIIEGEGIFSLWGVSFTIPVEIFK